MLGDVYQVCLCAVPTGGEQAKASGKAVGSGRLVWPPWPQHVALGPLLALQVTKVTMPSKASQAKAARVSNVHPLFRLSPLYHHPLLLAKNTPPAP